MKTKMMNPIKVWVGPRQIAIGEAATTLRLMLGMSRRPLGTMKILLGTQGGRLLTRENKPTLMLSA